MRSADESDDTVGTDLSGITDGNNDYVEEVDGGERIIVGLS